jgi:hypothetical protein
VRGFSSSLRQHVQCHSGVRCEVDVHSSSACNRFSSDPQHVELSHMYRVAILQPQPLSFDDEETDILNLSLWRMIEEYISCYPEKRAPSAMIFKRLEGQLSASGLPLSYQKGSHRLGTRRDGRRRVDFICRHRHVDNTSSMSSMSTMSIKRRHCVNNVGNCNM